MKGSGWDEEGVGLVDRMDDIVGVNDNDLELLKYMQVLYVVDTDESDDSFMNFDNMYLRDFDFTGKELHVHFNGADLRGAIFNNATLDFSEFKEAKLDDAHLLMLF